VIHHAHSDTCLQQNRVTGPWGALDRQKVLPKSHQLTEQLKNWEYSQKAASTEDWKKTSRETRILQDQGNQQ
jgi:hypothetical protein